MLSYLGNNRAKRITTLSLDANTNILLFNKKNTLSGKRVTKSYIESS